MTTINLNIASEHVAEITVTEIGDISKTVITISKRPKPVTFHVHGDGPIAQVLRKACAEIMGAREDD